MIATRDQQRMLRIVRGKDALGGQELMSSPGLPLLRTLIEENEEAEAEEHDRALGAPLLVVLSTCTASWFDWLAAGQALEKILLRTCSEGVSASFFNQPTEVATVCNELWDCIGRGEVPQMVLRMGYKPYVPPIPRRMVGEVPL
jgi:hypothetical protein